MKSLKKFSVSPGMIFLSLVLMTPNLTYAAFKEKSATAKVENKAEQKNSVGVWIAGAGLIVGGVFATFFKLWPWSMDDESKSQKPSTDAILPFSSGSSLALTFARPRGENTQDILAQTSREIMSSVGRQPLAKAILRLQEALQRLSQVIGETEELGPEELTAERLLSIQAFLARRLEAGTSAKCQIQNLLAVGRDVHNALLDLLKFISLNEDDLKCQKGNQKRIHAAVEKLVKLERSLQEHAGQK